MKKRILALFLSLVLCLSLLPIGVAAAKVSETGATFHIKPGTPKLDGVIDPVYTNNDTQTCMVINKESAPLVTGSDLHTNVTANVYMLYDANWIYFAAEVKDPTPINTANNGKIPDNYMTDGIELAFYDGSAIRRVCVSPWNEITNYGDDNHKGFFNSDGTQCRTAFNNSCQAAFTEPDQNGNYVIELAIPNRQYSLSDFFYFSIQLNDVFKKENGELILVAYGSQSMNSSMKFTGNVECENPADSMYYGVKYGQAMDLGTQLNVAKATKAPSLTDGGKLDEAYMNSTMLHIDAQTNNKQGTSGTDTSMDVRLLYDDTYIYAAIRVFDDNFIDSANKDGWIPGPVVKDENGVEQCYGFYTDGVEIFLTNDTNNNRRISVAPNDRITCAGKPGFFNSFDHESSSELNKRCTLAYSFSVDGKYQHEFPENVEDYDGIYYIELQFPHDGLIYEVNPHISFQVNDVYGTTGVWNENAKFISYGSQQKEYFLNFKGVDRSTKDKNYIYTDSDAIDPGEYVVALNGQPEVDGILDKIYEHAYFFTTDHEHMITTSKGGVGKSDAIAKTYVLHDEEYIYLATVVTESSLTDTTEKDENGKPIKIPGSWMIDGVELWIKTHGGQRGRISASPFFNDLYGDPQKLDRYSNFDDCDFGTSFLSDENKDGKPDGYIVEIAIPMEDRFTNGLNFSLQINDFIGNTNRYASYGIHGQKSGLLNWVIFSSETSAHNWSDWSNGSDNTQTRTCECGETQTQQKPKDTEVTTSTGETVKVQVSTDDSGNQSVVFPEAAVESIIKNTEDDTIRIDGTIVNAETTTEVTSKVTIPTAAIQQIEKAINGTTTEDGTVIPPKPIEKVEIEMSHGSVEFPSTMLTELSKKNDVSLSLNVIEQVHNENQLEKFQDLLPTKRRKDKLAEIDNSTEICLAVNVTLEADGDVHNLSEDDSEGATIFIPYDIKPNTKKSYKIIYITAEGDYEYYYPKHVTRGDVSGFEFTVKHFSPFFLTLSDVLVEEHDLISYYLFTLIGSNGNPLNDIIFDVYTESNGKRILFKKLLTDTTGRLLTNWLEPGDYYITIEGEPADRAIPLHITSLRPVIVP